LPVARDPGLIAFEKQVRQAIRDAVNHNSRKPFHWGGLSGYQQLKAIAQVLESLPKAVDETGYFEHLLSQVNRALVKNRKDARNLAEAHQWLRQIADCLHSPSKGPHTANFNSAQVASDMEALLQSFTPNPKAQFPQARLHSALQKRWRLHQQELLACYDVAGLPQDNLQMETLFEQLRRRQRRISGRKSTRELRNFGQAQILFLAESEVVLLEQIRHVRLADYRTCLARFAQAEQPRRFMQSLHHDPARAITRLVEQYLARYTDLSISREFCQTRVLAPVHTE
jgi:hypothetical protein